MTVGKYLDAAAAHLATATALIRDHRPANAGEQATVAVARVRVYRLVQQQLIHLTGVEPQQWAEQVTTGDPDAGRLAQFSELLSSLTLNTDGASPKLLPDVPVQGPVGVALHRTAQALASANRILAAHLGDRDHPRTPEGAALAARFQEADNLANTGCLALAAIDFDKRLSERRWLAPVAESGLVRQLLLRADQDARDATTVLHVGVAHQLATAGVGARGFSRSMAPLPRIDHPSAWTNVVTAREAIAAMDAARLWLFHYGHQMTAGQLAAAIRSGLELTVNASQVLLHTEIAMNGSAEPFLPTGGVWNVAARAAGELRSSERRNAPPVTVTSTALRAVSSWLNCKVCTELRGLSKIAGPESETEEPGTGGSDRLVSVWRQTVGQILNRLHDVTESLRTAAESVQQNGGLLGPAEPTSRLGRLIRAPQWRTVDPDDPVFRRLTNSLTDAAGSLRAMARTTGVRPLPNVHDAAVALDRRGRQTAGARGRLAAAAASAASTTPHLPGARRSSRRPRP